jgi:hypothetical protein
MLGLAAELDLSEVICMDVQRFSFEILVSFGSDMEGSEFIVYIVINSTEKKLCEFQSSNWKQ